MNAVRDCGGSVCSFAYSQSALSCQNGTGDCLSADLLEAEISEFHDQNLVEATHKIREILNSIPADKQGRKLSFLHTRMGILLAWVRVGEGEAPKGAITVESDNETLAKVLGIKDYSSAEASSA